MKQQFIDYRIAIRSKRDEIKAAHKEAVMQIQQARFVTAPNEETGEKNVHIMRATVGTGK